jgi:hypothetical protein
MRMAGNYSYCSECVCAHVFVVSHIMCICMYVGMYLLRGESKLHGNKQDGWPKPRQVYTHIVRTTHSEWPCMCAVSAHAGGRRTRLHGRGLT